MEIESNYCLEYLKQERIYIDHDEFKRQFRANPSYPSMLAISETLNFFNINHSIGKLESCNIAHLPSSFSALIEKDDSIPFNVYVERTNVGFRYLANRRWFEVNPNQFKEIFRNVILIIERVKEDKKNQKTSRVDKNTLFVFSIGLIYLGLVMSADYSLLNFLIALFSIFGLFFSSEAVQKEQGFDTRFSRKFCNIASNTDCGAIEKKSERNHLFFLSLGEFSTIFFSVQLLLLLISTLSKNLSSFYSLQFALLILCIPINAYSLYTQIFKVKKWCPICLGIVIILFAELLGLIIFNGVNFKFEWTLALQMLLSLALAILLLYEVKVIFRNNSKWQSELVELRRFKRSYKLFKLSLFAEDATDVNLQITHSLTCGNSKAKLKIVVVTSLFCSACAKFHNTIEQLLKQYSTEIAIEIRFMFDQESSDQLTKNIYYLISSVYLLQGADKFRECLDVWFRTKDYAALLEQFDSVGNKGANMSQEIEVMLHEQMLWGRARQIKFSPSVFINEYKFPLDYDLNDIAYFIKDLIEDSK